VGVTVWLLSLARQAWVTYQQEWRDFRAHLAEVWLEYVRVMEQAYEGKRIPEMRRTEALLAEEGRLSKMSKLEQDAVRSLFNRFEKWRQMRIWVGGGRRLKHWQEWELAASAMTELLGAMQRLKITAVKPIPRASKAHLWSLRRHWGLSPATGQALDVIRERLEKLGLLRE